MNFADITKTHANDCKTSSQNWILSKCYATPGYTYTYDSVGNLATEELNTTLTTYTHDSTNQLTADGATTLTYDATGNRNNGSYTTGTGNRITGDGRWTYSYDDEGNMTKKTKGASDTTWTYGWSNRNEMSWAEKRATDGGALQLRADYKYDVWGNRIEKQVDDDGDSTVDLTERYSLDGWRPGGGFIGNENWDIWADLNGSNALQTRYIRGDAIDQLFARIDSSDNEYWTLTDRLMSVRDIVDNNGTVKNTVAFDGFGNITSETDSSFRGRYTWTGRELDTETELQYNRARYYDANIGRWITQDPLGFDAGDANLYRYIKNAHATGIDPSGLYPANFRSWVSVSVSYQIPAFPGSRFDRVSIRIEYDGGKKWTERYTGRISRLPNAEAIYEREYQIQKKALGFPYWILLHHPRPTSASQANNIVITEYADYLREIYNNRLPYGKDGDANTLFPGSESRSVFRKIELKNQLWRQFAENKLNLSFTPSVWQKLHKALNTLAGPQGALWFGGQPPKTPLAPRGGPPPVTGR